MKKILFFTEDGWAFGSIHHGLIKELYKRGIYANILSWHNSYSLEEFDYFNRTYDLFVTTPTAVLLLYEKNIPLKKISAVAHGQWDILLAKKNATFDFYPELHSFGCISNILVEKCKEWGFHILPKIAELGIHFDIFYKKPSNKLKNVGYMAAYEVKNFFGQEIKRGRLFDDISRACPSLSFKKHNFYHHLATPSVYSDLDAVIMTSSEEAGGLPMMECAAAGRMPIGTPVGYFAENALNGGAGILGPLEENAFVRFATEALSFYQNNPEIYSDVCLYFQQFARDNYDWSHKIDDWIALFE
jgi:glycosyltransferase involved in cell wall biosynthesis